MRSLYLAGNPADTMSVKRALARLARKRTERDFLLFYFSGHAQPMRTKEGRNDIYLVTHDFLEDEVEVNSTLHLSMRELRQVLYESVGASIVVLILDCCYAGHIIRAGADPLQIDLRKLLEEYLEDPSDKKQQKRLRVMLTATGYDTPAQEVNGQGLMTSFLLPALRGEVDEVLDADGHVNILRLCDYLQRKMPGEQFPNLAGEFGQQCILASHTNRTARLRQQAKEDELRQVGKNILAELLKLHAETHHSQPFDYTICPFASFSDLDPKKVTEFFKQERVLQEFTFPFGANEQVQLQQLDFWRQDYPTYGALLCFGQNPTQWVSGATTRCVEWGSNNRSGGFQDSREYRGPLLRQFELSRDFLRKSLRLSKVIGREGRTEQWEVPFAALEEALANALIHREYANRTDSVQVEVFDDRIEISNPGNLPEDMTLELLQMPHESRPRNPQIAGIFYLHGYIEKLGTGIQKIQLYMKDAGLQEPEFKSGGDKRFKVILYRPKLTPNAIETIKTIWNVPIPRNPLFTGREDILKRLHDTLISNKTVALTQPQAISGLGGIGKTQTAVEYAYRYQSEYKVVLLTKADTRETLVSDFVTLAGLLNLPEKDAQDQSLAVAAVKRWLQTHRDWLLILDNADDLAMAREFIPSTAKGHILLTTRAEATGRLAQHIDIEKMEPEEGALLLLRRAGIIAQDDPIDKASIYDRAKAREISEIMDGLPLALDQAGAYIEEVACSLSDYLNLYRTRRTQLLKRRGKSAADHPEPVATTWSLSFEKVEKANSAADLLRLCAFLHPDAIPEEIITEGAEHLGPILQHVANDPFELNAAIEELRKFSLIRRDPETKTLTIHRLVQEVLKDGMDENTQRQWAERTVRAVNRALPYVEFKTWERCKRCLPHAQVCAELIEQWSMEFNEAARLLNQAGEYLQARAQYAEAEALYQHALAIREKTLGAEHPDVAQSLNNLARLYEAQGKYAQAESLYQHALAIREKTLGAEHPDVAQSLNNLARLYDVLGQYERAEPLYLRALVIDEQVPGLDHTSLAIDLNNLALLYYNQGKYAEAEPLYQRALAIDEKTLGPDHPDVATDLNNLALLYQTQGKYTDRKSTRLNSSH